MEPSDRLAYKLQVTHSGVTTDYAYKMTSADVETKANAIPLLTAILDNSDLFFTSTVRILDGDSITLQASHDGGATYFTLFHGRASDRTGAMDSEGKETYSVYAEGGGNVADMPLSPDQVVFYLTDISLIGGSAGYGNIFQGHPGDVSGNPWGADSQGNYPNGLLYKTGYALDASSSMDFIAGTLDIVSPIMFDGTKGTYETMKYLCELYGAMFFFDDANMKVIVRKQPVAGMSGYDYPSSGVAIVRGLTLNTIAAKDLGYETYDKVTVIGSTPSNFSTVGVGHKELIQRESSLTGRQTVIEKAYQLYARRGAQKGATVSAPAIGEAVIGRRVEVIDEVHNAMVGGRRPFGNVVGVSHQLAKDRWLTTLSLECLARNTPIILSEIEEQEKESNEISSTAQMYLNPRAAGNGSLGSYGNICAMGVGNSSRNFTVKPIEDYYADTARGLRHAYLTLGPGEANARINRVRLYGNNLSSNALRNYTVVTKFARSTPTTDSAGDRWIKVCDTPDTLAGYYPINIQTVSGLNGNAADIEIYIDSAGGWTTRHYDFVNTYSFNLSNASRIRCIMGTAAAYSVALYYPDDSKWGTDLNAGGLASNITDSTQIANATVDFSNGIDLHLDPEGSAHGILLLIDWDTKLGNDVADPYTSSSYCGLDGVIWATLNALGWAETSDGSPIFELWAWSANGNASNGGPEWVKCGNYSGSTQTFLSVGGPAFAGTKYFDYFVDVKGHIYLLLRTYNNGTGLGLHLGYASASLNVNSNTFASTTSSRIVEKCAYDSKMGKFSLENVPSKLNGVYPALHDNGNGSYSPAGPELSGYFLQTGERSYQHRSTVNEALKELPSIWDTWNGEPVSATLYRQGWILADYTVDRIKYVQGPSVPTLEASDYKVVWKDNYFQRAEIWAKVNKNMPAYGAYLAIQYSCVGGPMVSEATVSSASRISEGVDKNPFNQANICYTIDGSAGNPGTIKGIGVDSP